MDYKIHLLPTDAKSIKDSRLKVLDRGQRFVAGQFKNKLFNKESFDNKEMLLMEGILEVCFWRVLNNVDGYDQDLTFIGYGHSKTEAERKEHAVKTREWAQQKFGRHELEEILNIAVNQALVRPLEIPAPGYSLGHSIIYEKLVAKEESMFASAVTPEFKKRLNNGRFWEELPGVATGNWLSTKVVFDVLLNHFEDLDVGFVPEGLSLMKIKPTPRAGYFNNLGEEALAKYVSFVEKIDLADVAKKSDIEILLQPYTKAVLAWDHDLESPYYGGIIDYDNNQRGRFQDKLNAPVMQKYLESSDEMRKYAAKLLAEGICNHNKNEHGQYAKFMQEVLSVIPNGRKLMTNILVELQAEDALIFFNESKKKGYDLMALIS